MFCKVCGKELAESALFCGNCGSKVGAQNEKTSVSEVTSTETTNTPAEDVDAAETSAPVEDVDAAEAPVPAEDVDAAETPAPAEDITVATVTSEQVDSNTMETTPIVTPVASVQQEVASATVKTAKDIKEDAKVAKEAVKAAKVAAKAERLRYMVQRNRVISTVFCVFLSIITTVVMFLTAGVGVLSIKEFDDFYMEWKYTNFGLIMSFWSLWLLLAVLVLLILLMFVSIKRRKYAIFNYVGIPMTINGIIFMVVALLSEAFAELFDFSEPLEEMFGVIGDEAKNSVLYAGVILIAAGVLFILLYILIAVIHKATYRKKVKKAEKNQ